MPNQKISELDAIAAVTADDLFVVVNDPGGVPVTKKVTTDNLLSSIATIGFTGKTIANLGTVTTADINGGTVDGVIIGGASAAAGTFTTATAASVLAGGLTGKYLGHYYSAGTNGGIGEVQGTINVPSGARFATITVIGNYYNNIEATHVGYYQSIWSVGRGTITKLFDVNHTSGTNQGFTVTYNASTITVANKGGMTANQSGYVYIIFYGT